MYFVCTREEEDCKELYGGAWGYYWNKEDAVDAVHRNVTDIHETIYPYAIIERLEQGLFPVPKEREWCGWDDEKYGFYERYCISTLSEAFADLPTPPYYPVSFL